MGAVQALLNGRMRVELDDPFAAAALSFGLGLVIVAAIVFARRSLREQTLAFLGEIWTGKASWVLLLGGLGGAIFVTAQTLAAPVVGVAMLTIFLVAGQSVTGLGVDRASLGPGGPRRLSTGRLIGAALMVVAVALSMSGGLSGAWSWVLIVPLVAGAAVSLQQAVNGHVTERSGHFLVATLVNTTVGTAALLLLTGVHALLVHGPRALPTDPVLYLTGPLGIGFIAIAAMLAGPLGVLTLGMCTVAGQVVASVIIDAIASPGTLDAWTVAGAVLTLIAAAVTAGRGSRA